MQTSNSQVDFEELKTATLLHHGLYGLPKPHNGLYWLRLYRLQNQRHIAFVTEVPGNPNPMSGTAFIRRLMGRELAIEQVALDLILIWPKRRLLNGRIVDATASWLPSNSVFDLRDLDRPTIRAALALLPPLPDHAQLFAEVVARGGARRDVKGETWQVIDVHSLPAPHLPFKCRHYGRFQKMVGSEKTIEAHLRAGKRFLESLTAVERQQCPYHRADWAAIADASAEIVSLSKNAHRDDYIARAKRWRLPASDRRCLVDLFDEPIVLPEDWSRYVNGQHRGCALRFSGAARVAVVIEGRVSHEVRADWTYLGDG